MSITEPAAALNLDFKQQKLFVTFFNSLPEKPTSTLRFFNHADYYTLHGEDAAHASTFTGNIVKYMGEEPKLSYVVLRKTQFDSFVRDLLLVKQYRVEVYVKTSPNKINEWSVEYKGSPGNLSQFEEILFENAAITFSNYVMGARIVKGSTVAVACVNSTELRFQVCELNDNECFTELEALIAQIGPRECIIPQGETPTLVELKKVLERNGVLVAKVKSSDFATGNVVQDLDRLLFFGEGQQRSCLSLPETDLTEALACLNAVIKFLNLTADERNFNQFKISTVDIYRFVRLDNAALYSLNILPKPGTTTNEDAHFQPNNVQSFCLKGVLDKCTTNQGRRLLQQWIKQPLKDINLINERHDIVESLYKDSETRQLLQSDILTRLSDLLLLSKKLSSKKATLQDCYRVYQIVRSVPGLVKVLKRIDDKCVSSVLVHPIEDIRNDLERYQNMIEEILDMEIVDRGEFLVKPTFCTELNEIYDNKRRIEEKMQGLLRSVASALGIDDKVVKLESTDQHGYFFRVTLKEEPTLRASTKFKIIDAVKGGVRFTNTKLEDLNSDYSEAKSAYEEQQKAIIGEIFDVAVGYGDSLRNLNVHIATVDVLVSFAEVSVMAKIPYTRPKLHEAGKGVLKLFKARHPCIEQQEHVSFIPNSVEFEHGDKTLHIITGPNMCGKSTFIRSVGVCVLMAQIGCFVPCSYAEIPLVDAILARVGAEDCQWKGLSTFMVEMIEAAAIIKTATCDSLVIIDELGRGTSTYDGCGIAFAIAEYLAKEVKCFALFATHFHEITRLGEMYSSVSNKHVTAVTTDDTITPLYQIKEGECDNSYGIHCAKMVEFPEDVIQSAVQHQKSLEHSAGTQLIKNYEQSLKRQVIKNGDKIIEDVIERAKNLDVDSLSDEDLLQEVNKLKNELEGSENLFIKGLLSSQ